jgi:hypothetical protein
MDTLLLEHVAGDGGNAGEGGFAGEGGSFLEAGFDGVDRGVRKGAHGAGDEADYHGLPGGEFGGRVGLKTLEGAFELGVGGEIYCLCWVRGLAIRELCFSF